MLILFNWVLTQAMGNPSGGLITQGSANIQYNGQRVDIHQSSHKAILEWSDFSVHAGEITEFHHPDSTAATLNRVVGGLPSTIDGLIKANGQVYLINTNGIVLGPSGRIEAGSFVGSTLDVNDAEFMSGGDLLFSGNSQAEIRIEGEIESLQGDVILLSRTVINNGSIKANGTVALGAGSQILLKESSEERIFIQLPNHGAHIDNAGQIEAARAELKAAGGNLYALAVNNRGVIRASGTGLKDGQVWLTGGLGKTINSGEITATRALNGGDVYILGEAVELQSGSIIDVSGTNNGGNVLIGGDYQGGNAAIQNASYSTIDAGALIRADAGTEGDGGRVIVWADKATSFHGEIFARGGALSGNGGFVEVSGKEALDYSGFVDLRATFGETGQLLLDPDDIEIVSGGAATFPLPPAGTVQMDPATILTALSTADVTILANNSITITDNIVGLNPTNNNLTFDANGAAGNIVIAATKIDIAGGDLLFNSPTTVNAASFEAIANKITTVESLSAGAAATGLIFSADDMDLQKSIDYTGKRITLRTRNAGVAIDLGTRTDLAANVLELSNDEIKRIQADTMVIGSTDAGNIFLSQKIAPQNINTLHLMTSGDILKGTPSTTAFDLSTWSMRGLNGGGHGDWTVGGGGTSVTQTPNAQTPTFFMSDNTDGFVNVIFEGSMEIAVGAGDDDFIGFVFGSQKPSNNGDVEFDFYLFDWVQGVNKFAAANQQTFMLSKVDDPNNSGNHSANALWTRTDNAVVDALQTNSTTPWAEGVNYDFRISYNDDQVVGEIKGGAFGAAYTEVINYTNPDPVNNPLPAGDFGFYNFSQGGVTYSDFTLTELPSLQLSSQNLAITAGGNVNLTENIDVSNIAINAGGSVNFKDVNGFNITSVDGVNGIQAGGDITLNSSVSISQDQSINGTSLELSGSGNFDLTHTSNDIDTLAASASALNFRDDDGWAIGTVGATNGITTTNNTQFQTSGTVTQSQAINTSGLTLLGSNGNYILNDANNRSASIAADTGNLSYREDDAVQIGTIGATSGLSATGNITLQSNTNVTQTAAISSNGLELLGAGAHYQLKHNNNRIQTIAANTGSIDLINNQSLTIGTVNTTGIRTSGTTTIETTGASSDILITESIVADTTSTANAADASIVLATSNNFHNSKGVNALDSGNGHWLIYSSNPNNDTTGSLESVAKRQYNINYASDAPATITPANDNFILYSHQPTLTITADDLSRTYGANNPGLSYSVSGLISGDNLADFLSGAPLLSTLADTSSNTGTYTISAALGTLNPSNGYLVNLQNGSLNVNKATLQVDINDFSRAFGENNPTFSAAVSGFLNGDTINDIDTPLHFATSAGLFSAQGAYSITGNGSDNNYDFNFIPGQLTVTPNIMSTVTLTKIPPHTVILTRNFGSKSQGGNIIVETAALRPEGLWPPPEFPTRMAEQGNNIIITRTPWISNDERLGGNNTNSNHNYDVTGQSFVHKNFDVYYRSSNTYNSYYEKKGDVRGFDIMTQSSYHEFLDQEHSLSDLTLLSSQ